MHQNRQHGARCKYDAEATTRPRTTIRRSSFRLFVQRESEEATPTNRNSAASLVSYCPISVLLENLSWSFPTLFGRVFAGLPIRLLQQNRKTLPASDV
jgi:hypothetical protein